MKIVEVIRDYTFRVPGKRVFIQYSRGATYKRVPEVQARAIVSAGAGKVVEDDR